MDRISDASFKALASGKSGPALKMLNPGVDFCVCWFPCPLRERETE